MAKSAITLIPSPLRLNCLAKDCIFQWKGVNTPAPITVQHKVITSIADIANHASLQDPASYGAGLRKFHIFCDIFAIPEADHLPTSFPVLHSFVLWAATDPDRILFPMEIISSTLFEPISPQVVSKYLAAIRAWHIAQGWPPPLSPENHDRIAWSLRGLQRAQGARKRPPRPPITLAMLTTLQATLDLNSTFDACVWAMAATAFWGLLRFGEVSVQSRASFSPGHHLKRADVIIGLDLDKHVYGRLDLPSAKTAAPGVSQQVFLVQRKSLCPLAALANLIRVTPAGATDPLFSWRDRSQRIRPMVGKKALTRIAEILEPRGYGTLFGHSFRIGGASYYLAQGVSPEIVRLAGRWRSLAYETYVRAFEQIASRHLA
ncbi:DNA breaking-rejoining enzyme [Macrolepiota fuliginosa MF-IS2]|uniref:DNA breaking-rejoining enzyme n=1 Tax=Macrolepiota fuliginosa MF-IS2 TaxID=1400762 RepID=A0A9P5X3P7_9AGAR|nr:DNA breaking-rejoining enzyme [Macrolepiota fuliginosa MF-IS2]